VKGDPTILIGLEVAVEDLKKLIIEYNEGS
jgi:hypothetical protein